LASHGDAKKKEFSTLLIWKIQ